MKLLKPFMLTWWQSGLFKISMASFGVAIGVLWPHVLGEYLPLFWLLFALPAIYLTYVWWRQ
jgi:hypothetical protein